MLIEGRNAVVEALRADMPLSRVLIAEGVAADKLLTEIADRAARAGTPVVTTPRRKLDALSERGAHQGVIGEAEDFAYVGVDDLVAIAADRERALIVALDHVTDPGNFGAVVRTAEVVGATGVLVPSRRSAGVTPAAWKSAAGAFAHVAVAREANLVRALERLKGAGFWVAGADETAEQTIWDAPLDGRLVLVMGSEGEGLARLTRENCDFLVSLPQRGKVGSLNVAQATTAIAYEWVRRETGKE